MNALNQLKSVLCDPSGKCSIAGSDEDRAIVDRALQAIEQAEKVEPVAWWDKKLGCFDEKHFDQLQPLYLHPPTAPAQDKPVAKLLRWGEPGTSSESISLVALAKLPPDGTLLYTHSAPAAPAQQPLTDEQIKAIINALPTGFYGDPVMLLARAIEAAHGIKGASL